ncbi:hypothetical protein XELAEV_18014211mg [Xenopus laevis]|uniref:Uncharacterized protein n=1 Tax=Xenopus laevis TaxID=8355 RepID=A0A974DHH2_XENLA|nr:hypothetical protein XELAEV_18014211mg [Xenopus laevis]
MCSFRLNQNWLCRQDGGPQLFWVHWPRHSPCTCSSNPPDTPEKCTTDKQVFGQSGGCVLLRVGLCGCLKMTGECIKVSN